MSHTWLDEWVSIGEYTDSTNVTGSSTLVFESPLPCALHLCGCAPASREALACDPGCSVEAVHALHFSGGSAFGLDGAAGAMRYLREMKKGVDTGYGIVPVCPSACIFDFTEGTPVAPQPEDVYQACRNSRPFSDAKVQQAAAGTGARSSKGSPNGPQRGGVGIITLGSEVGATVTAYVVANPYGDIITEKGCTEVASHIESGASCNSRDLFKGKTERSHTTLVALFVNAKLDRAALLRICKMATAGIARAILPAFTPFDGDVIFAFSVDAWTEAPNYPPAHVETHLGHLAAKAVTEAIRSTVSSP